jgi:hypothetical protein
MRTLSNSYICMTRNESRNWRFTCRVFMDLDLTRSTLTPPATLLKNSDGSYVSSIRIRRALQSSGQYILARGGSQLSVYAYSCRDPHLDTITVGFGFMGWIVLEMTANVHTARKALTALFLPTGQRLFLRHQGYAPHRFRGREPAPQAPQAPDTEHQGTSNSSLFSSSHMKMYQATGRAYRVTEIDPLTSRNRHNHNRNLHEDRANSPSQLGGERWRVSARHGSDQWI